MEVEGKLESSIEKTSPHIANETPPELTEDLDHLKPKEQLPEIPEDLFVEYAPPSNSNQNKAKNLIKLPRMEPQENSEIQYNLQYLYDFLERDYQQEGYNDALSNPDMSNMEEKVKLIRRQLIITIAKVNAAYNTALRNINFHIESRSRNGMVDIVDELVSRRTNLLEEIGKVAEIEEGAKMESGISETPVLSYKLGFKNGYAAISHSQLA
jgi:hypothetical protein